MRQLRGAAAHHALRAQHLHATTWRTAERRQAMARAQATSQAQRFATFQNPAASAPCDRRGCRLSPQVRPSTNDGQGAAKATLQGARRMLCTSSKRAPFAVKRHPLDRRPRSKATFKSHVKSHLRKPRSKATLLGHGNCKGFHYSPAHVDGTSRI